MSDSTNPSGYIEEKLIPNHPILPHRMYPNCTLIFKPLCNICLPTLDYKLHERRDYATVHLSASAGPIHGTWYLSANIHQMNEFTVS